LDFLSRIHTKDALSSARGLSIGDDLVGKKMEMMHGT
jgi:hypothetical protein